MTIMLKGFLKSLKKSFKYISASIIIALLLPFILFSLFHIIPNNFVLNEFKRNFDKLDHPQDAEKLAEDSFVGNFVGNGNKCMLVVSALFTTEKDYEGIIDFYRGRMIESPGQNDKVEVELGFYDKGKLRFSTASAINDYQLQKFKDRLPFEKLCFGKGCYIAYAIDVSRYHYEIRCQ